jgi:hypothetical protein
MTGFPFVLFRHGSGQARSVALPQAQVSALRPQRGEPSFAAIEGSRLNRSIAIESIDRD